MAELKNHYETIFVVDASKPQPEIDALVEKFKALIEKEAKIEEIDIWGKKRLAYEINFKSEGYYVLIYFTADSEFPKELERNYRITEGILRSLVVRRDERYLDYMPKFGKAAKSEDEAVPAQEEKAPAEVAEKPVEVPAEEAVEAPVEEAAPAEEVVEVPAEDAAPAEEEKKDVE